MRVVTRFFGVVALAASIGLLASCAGQAIGDATQQHRLVVAPSLAPSVEPSVDPSVSASIDAENEAFLKAVGLAIPLISKEVSISVGDRVCSAYEEGRTTEQIRVVLTEKGLTLDQVSTVMLAAVSTMCPEYWELPASG